MSTSVGELLPVAIARVRNVLTDYRRELEQLGAERTLCIGTSAVRDADNGEAFLGEIEWSYGFATRMLTGDEEAELTLRGIGAVESGTLVVDIGGGSTELQLTGTDLRVSLDIGCVRLTERYGEDVHAVRAHVRGLLPDAKPERAIGVAGTVTTIAALDLGLPAYDPEQIHGHTISSTGRAGAHHAARRSADRGAARASRSGAGTSAGDRRRRCDPRLEILAFYGLDEIVASERDLLHGVALAAAELPPPVEGDAPPGAYVCC